MKTKTNSGITSLELTVLILVLLSLLSLLFIGARAWKKGNDCAMQQVCFERQALVDDVLGKYIRENRLQEGQRIPWDRIHTAEGEPLLKKMVCPLTNKPFSRTVTLIKGVPPACCSGVPSGELSHVRPQD